MMTTRAGDQSCDARLGADRMASNDYSCEFIARNNDERLGHEMS